MGWRISYKSSMLKEGFCTSSIDDIQAITTVQWTLEIDETVHHLPDRSLMPSLTRIQRLLDVITNVKAISKAW